MFTLSLSFCRIFGQALIKFGKKLAENHLSLSRLSWLAKLETVGLLYVHTSVSIHFLSSDGK